ncbi:DUF1715-domain-containing protein [Piromyces finnis]|uniref:DUF1715-domain-containing protein n=1 Tax=Piromyces finnis TaxID=1754191 RepID=A0A1Y1VN94_9FUNG|nr:DUF1715-domain-containing protein [Piromyces finnis]|eukprot:ORX60888.1 DUF1715-domain-containing protein [Piromyces finnis]
MSFDELLFIEEDFIKKGYDSGIAAGEEFGKREGFECGVENGYSYGVELGYYRGFLKVYKSHFIDVESDPKVKEHKEKLYNSIIEMINDFTSNPDQIVLVKLRSKFKMLLGNIKSKAAINDQLDSLQFNNRSQSEKPLCFKGEDIDF